MAKSKEGKSKAEAPEPKTPEPEVKEPELKANEFEIETPDEKEEKQEGAKVNEQPDDENEEKKGEEVEEEEELVDFEEAIKNQREAIHVLIEARTEEKEIISSEIKENGPNKPEPVDQEKQTPSKDRDLERDYDNESGPRFRG